MKSFIVCILIFTASNLWASGIDTAKRYIRLHDYEHAVKILTTLANKNNTEAQYQLGVLYRNGTGVQQNYVLSRKWLLKACLNGHAKAQYSLANLYQNGLGVKPDNRKAIKWYAMAAKQGHDKAKMQLKKIQQGNIDPRNDSNPDQQLLQASQRGSIAKVRYFIKKGAHINISDHTGSTPLIYAAGNGHTEIVKYLLQKKAKTNTANQYHETAISIATKNNHDDIVRQLIKANSEIDMPDNNGMTPLMYAVTQKNMKSLISLLDAGANPRKTNHHKQNAITLALRDNNTKAISIFKRRGISVSANTRKERNQNNIETIRSMATGSETALMIAAGRGQTKALRALIAKRPKSIFETNNKKQSALSYAVSNNHYAATDILLKAGSKPNHTLSDGSTPIYFAIRNANARLVSLLVKNGAKVNISDANGDTPLLLAAKVGSRDIIKIIMQQNNSKLIDDKDGYSPIEQAIIHQHPEDALLIYSSQHSIPRERLNKIMHLSASYGADTLLRKSIKAGAEIESVDKNDMTALMLAASQGNLDSIKVLLQAGANPNQSSQQGYTALMQASQHGKNSAVKLLCQSKSINLDIRNQAGNTALIIAVLSKQNDIVQTLLEQGADRNIRNKDKRNASDIATASGFTKISKLLAMNNKKGFLGIF